jgi:hypothetical protein
MQGAELVCKRIDSFEVKAMRRRIITGVLAGIMMLLLIMDPETQLAGARDGITLCIATVIPSLFPFFVLTGLITSALVGVSSPVFRLFGRLCGMTPGTEPLLIIGLLGGYPAGAQAVRQSWRDGVLSDKEARRMMGFCNNPGPAFLFGICGPMFPAFWMVWILWGVVILSSVFTAAWLPSERNRPLSLRQNPVTTLPKALESGVKTAGIVCGWVVLFRILIAYLQKWVFAGLPPAWSCLLSGILELTNGCCALAAIPHTGLRFMLAALMLTCGGVCVGMQTASLTGRLGIGCYLRGKMIQTVFAITLALPVSVALECGFTPSLLPFCVPCAIFVLICAAKRKKRSGNSVAVGV